MASQKAYFSIAFLFTLVFLSTSCNKAQTMIEGDPTQYIISVTNPKTGEGFYGVKFTLVEQQTIDPGLGAKIKKDTIAQLITDSSGHANVTFYKKYSTNTLDYHYGYVLEWSDINGQIGGGYQLVNYEQNVPIDTNNNKYGFYFEFTK